MCINIYDFVGFFPYFDSTILYDDRKSVVDAVNICFRFNTLTPLNQILHGRAFATYLNVMKKRFQPLFREDCDINNLSDLSREIGNLKQSIWEEEGKANSSKFQGWKKRVESLRELKKNPRAWDNFLVGIQFEAKKINYPLVNGKKRTPIKQSAY